MAEQLSKHCWATAKCGISLAEIYFKGVDRPNNYTFIVVRNPYSRLTSFYMNKVVYQGNPPWDYKDSYDNEIIIPHLGSGNTGFSFEELVHELKKVNIRGAERHLKPQCVGVLGREFDKWVQLENFKEDIREVCEELDFDYDVITERKSNHFPRIDIDYYIGDRPTKWLRENGLPKDWRMFYNEETLEIVRQIYKEDFRWLSQFYEETL